ncbi:hypothetical protein DYB28_005816 [Aphanomyces astaci]|uniref:Uncharacterized protein n=1 Tax=Aphanomyces astaci TaxID=112090 RepID=A0A9X8DWP9_APHAT|nr:hypothetical protein DYB28_005816 [Aphanomyces astaci]
MLPDRRIIDTATTEISIQNEAMVKKILSDNTTKIGEFYSSCFVANLPFVGTPTPSKKMSKVSILLGSVLAVSLPPQNQAEMDELRMQSVERAAASSSQYNQMIYEQLAQFHAQQEAMGNEVVQVTLLQQQEDLIRQQDELKRTVANQAKATAEHQEMLRQASDAMQQQHYMVEELNKKLSSVAGEAGAATSRVENLMGVQQLPLAPKYKGNTKRERCEFMDVYLAYSRRVEVLNRGVGGTLFLMPLAACIDQNIVSRVCAHDKSFAEITEND